MKPKPLLLIISVVSLFTVSCKKNNISPSDKPIDIYLGGYVKEHYNTAAYWKNGVMTLLGDTSKISYAQGVAVQGKDVYVAGIVTSADAPVSNAVYWKNGTLTNLSGGANGNTCGIAVSSNGDIYVAGLIKDPINGNNHSVYWKNNVAIPLTDGIATKAIVLNGSDVYIAGSAGDTNNALAAYWKNGTKVLLQGGYTVNSIAVVGNDVYAGGQTSAGVAIYWKNGTPTLLSASAIGVQNGNGFSEILAIAANSSDMYAAGISPANDNGSAAAYWKNNTLSILTAQTTIAPNNPLNNSAWAISLYNADVYITSQVVNNVAQESESFLWKNGVPTKISGNGSAIVAVNSMAVVPQP